MEVKRAETIDYSQSVKRDSSYRHMVIKQQTGADDQVVGNAQITSVFELPPVPMNLAKSFLNFNQDVPAQGAGNYSHVFRDTAPIAQLELLNRGGQYLCRVDNFQEFCISTARRNKKITDLLMAANTGDILVGDAGTDVIDKHTSSGDNQTQTVRWRISFEELYHTAMSVDKSILFGETLLLRVTWAPSTHQAYQSDNVNPFQGTAADLTGNITMSRITLYLAQEQNPAVAAALQEQLNSGGMSVLIPYPHTYKVNVPTGTAQNVSVRLNRAHGSSVERIYTYFKSGAEEKDTRFDAKTGDFSSLYALLNSRRLSEFDYKIDAPNSDIDWLLRDRYRGLAVNADNENKDNNLTWEDSWCSGLECARKQIQAGLSLEGAEIKYELFVTLNNSQPTNYYQSVICQKQCMISSAGISVV